MSGADRREGLEKPLLLPPDALLFPVRELADQVRATLDCGDDDYALTRPGLRTFSRIVDADTAALLREYRTPTPLVVGVLRYSRRCDRDPERYLEAIFPALVGLINAGFLVPEDSPLQGGIAASLAPGQRIADFELRRPVQVLQDTELYQARAADGATVALKIARPPVDPHTAAAIAREAAILARLGGGFAPALVASGTARERPYLATSWRSGVPISRFAWEQRLAATPAWRAELHALGCRLLDVYAELHARGVIHGDVHPKNLLVDRQGRVTLLDFGLARVPGGPAELDHRRRAGLVWTMEPALAAALLGGTEPPPASFAGEQYALAALLYYLFCGAYPVGGAPEAEALYRQVVDAPPPAFSRHGAARWPATEAVLARALAKHPEARFADLRAFASGLLGAPPPRSARPRGGGSAGSSEGALGPLLAAILERTVGDPQPYGTLFPSPPQASLQSGAAGLAWFLYRTSLVRSDPALLAAADHWARQALARLDDPHAFAIPGLAARPDLRPLASLHHGPAGVHLVQALIGHARGDLATAGAQLGCFLAIADTADTADTADKADAAGGALELAFGGSGMLLGGALLLEPLRWSQRLDVAPLRAWLQRAAARLDRRTAALPTIGEGRELPHLGIAHGWAGVLYAQLLVHRLERTAPSAATRARLAQLAALAVPHGRGAAWLGTVPHAEQRSETPAYAPGWCAGSAGQLALWIVAHELLGDDAYRMLAEQAAWHAWEHEDRSPRLCCGASGRAFALLHLYRYSGERAWLERARLLARDALAAVADAFVWDANSLGLYFGPLGAVLLAVELEQPEAATMPLFGSEGWPAP